MAPSGFGWASHQLLIGNVDSGQISVFDPETGAYIGPLTEGHRVPIEIDGIRAMIFAHDANPPQLYFAAGCAFPTGLFTELVRGDYCRRIRRQ